jgi:hypothetical protein
MAPLSPDHTPRYFLDYTTCGFEHTLMCRTDSGVDPADVSAVIAAFLAAIGGSFRQLDIVDFRFADAGTNITVPVTWGGAASYGSGSGSPYESAHYMDFIGRGSTGRRVRVAVFGMINSSAGGDYRLIPSESGVVAAAIAELTSDAQMFLDIDFTVPVWKNYANVGVNAYWRNKIRS